MGGKVAVGRARLELATRNRSQLNYLVGEKKLQARIVVRQLCTRIVQCRSLENTLPVKKGGKYFSSCTATPVSSSSWWYKS